MASLWRLGLKEPQMTVLYAKLKYHVFHWAALLLVYPAMTETPGSRGGAEWTPLQPSMYVCIRITIRSIRISVGDIL